MDPLGIVYKNYRRSQNQMIFRRSWQRRWKHWTSVPPRAGRRLSKSWPQPPSRTARQSALTGTAAAISAPRADIASSDWRAVLVRTKKKMDDQKKLLVENLLKILTAAPNAVWILLTCWWICTAKATPSWNMFYKSAFTLIIVSSVTFVYPRFSSFLFSCK